MKINEIVYYCLDAIKAFSDDSYVNEDHILFLLGKYRGALLQQYNNIKKAIPESNYQTICINMQDAETIPCIGGPRLVSVETVPTLMTIGRPSVLLYNGMESEVIEFVPFSRLKSVGYNRWKKNFVYAAIGSDGKLYLSFSNPQAQYIEKLRIKGIFEDYEKALMLSCDCDDECSASAECPVIDDNSIVDGALYLSNLTPDSDGYITINTEGETLPIGEDNMVILNSANSENGYIVTEGTGGEPYTPPTVTFDIMEQDFPMEVTLVPDLIARVVRDALGIAWRMTDQKNNANDDLADIATYVRSAMKRDFRDVVDTEQ